VARETPAALAGGPHLIAHRGGSALAPENTMAAFRQAVDVYQADMIELDVRASADGRCVVIHDDTVDRTTDGTGAVADLPFAALRELDAGWAYVADANPAGGGERDRHPYRGRGIGIPAIEEVLEALPATTLVVEVKARAAQAPLFDAVRRLGATDRVVAAGMYDSDRDQFAGYAGPVSASGEQLRAFLVRHKLRLGRPRLEADVVQAPERYQWFRIITRRFIRALHAQNVPVHVWTVNDPADMRRLLEWGVDGLVTDRPDLLRGLLDGRPAPAPAFVGRTAGGPGRDPGA